MTPLAEHVAWLRDKRDYYDLLWLGDTDHQWLSASRHQLVEAFKHANRLLWAPPDPATCRSFAPPSEERRFFSREAGAGAGTWVMLQTPGPYVLRA
jgi:hypothetical protein